MPFKSVKQQRKCYALRKRNQAGSWDCEEWSAHTDFKKLPQKVGFLIGQLAGQKAAAVPGLPGYVPTPGFPANVPPGRSPLDMLSWSELLSQAIDRQQPGQTPPQLLHDPRIRTLFSGQMLQYDPSRVPGVPRGVAGPARQLQQQRVEDSRTAMRAAQGAAGQQMTGQMNQANQNLSALRAADAVTRVPLATSPFGAAANAAMGRPLHGLLTPGRN